MRVPQIWSKRAQASPQSLTILIPETESAARLPRGEFVGLVPLGIAAFALLVLHVLLPQDGSNAVNVLRQHSQGPRHQEGDHRL